MSTTAEQLTAALAESRRLIDTRFPDGSAHGAAAVLLEDGTILTGTSPDFVVKARRRRQVSVPAARSNTNVARSNTATNPARNNTAPSTTPRKLSVCQGRANAKSMTAATPRQIPDNARRMRANAGSPASTTSVSPVCAAILTTSIAALRSGP